MILRDAGTDAHRERCRETAEPMSAQIPENSTTGPVEAYWRFRAWTVPITIVIGLLAGLFVLATSGTTTASTTLYLTDPRGTPVFRDGSSTPTDLARYARQRAEFADSAAVHEAVAAALDGETAESIDDVVVSRTTTSSDVRLDCTADSEERALQICDAVVAAYLELTELDTIGRADATVNAFLKERQRLVDQDGGQGTIDQIDLQIAEVRSEAALLGNGVEFVEPAEVNSNARILPALQYMIAGMLFAAFATAIVAWFRAGRRPVVGSSSDVTASLDAPLLGEVTEAPAGRFDPALPPGASYQLLATSLGAVRPNAVRPHGGVVLTATATPSHDAADTVARLAVAAAREGRRVLVIDANLHDRRVSRLFGFETAVGGFTEILAGLAVLDDVRRTVGVGGAATLDLVIGGRSVDDPAGLFRSQAAHATLHTMRSQYDLILIDVPPLLAVADGSAIAGDSDGIILIVERGSDARDLDIVRQRLDVLRTELIGVVYDHRSGDH
jgi:succinoglycan biosynthesis transport protein ExoP